MRPTVRTLLATVVAAAVLAGCGEPSAPQPLTATVTHSRAAQARGLINVILGNPTDRTIQVRTLALDDDRFAPVPTTHRLVTLAPRTERLMVPIPLGTGRCAGVLQTPTVLADGDAVQIDADGLAVLDRLEQDACARDAIERTASVAFTDEVSHPSPIAVDVVLRVERRQGERTVTIDSIGSNVIFTVTSRDVPATLGSDDETIDVTVRFSAERCEPHALAESKKTFQFPLWVALDGGDAEFVEHALTGVTRDALQDALDACAAARG